MSQTPKRVHLEELENRKAEKNFDNDKLLYAHDLKSNKWVAIDVTLGEQIYVEDFQTEEQAIAWLNNGYLSASEARKIVNDPELESKTGNMFKELDKKESFDYRAWARENYTPGNWIPEVWHPEVRDECRKMNEEQNEEKINWREEFDKLPLEKNTQDIIENYMDSHHGVKCTKEEILYIAKSLLNDPNANSKLKKKYFMAASVIEEQESGNTTDLGSTLDRIFNGL